MKVRPHAQAFVRPKSLILTEVLLLLLDFPGVVITFQISSASCNKLTVHIIVFSSDRYLSILWKIRNENNVCFYSKYYHYYQMLENDFNLRVNKELVLSPVRIRTRTRLQNVVKGKLKKKKAQYIVVYSSLASQTKMLICPVRS